MTKKIKYTFVGTAPYNSFGWLRRKVMDNKDDGYCYETPDGDLVYSKNPEHKFGARLEIWMDEDGEKFCTLPPARKIIAR
jgi:hypothetical protein